jgi:dsRNA-specific ribonuclease
MRASLVNENSLYKLAKKIKLNEFIIMSEEEILRKGNLRKAALSDTYEAVIGAIFLDQGYDETKNIVINLFIENLKNLNIVKTFKDPKSELQESLQSMKFKPPKYITSIKSGPPHNPVFETKLFIGNKLINKSEGYKKIDSEKKVATDTLKMIENNKLEFIEEKSLLKKIIDNFKR